MQEPTWPVACILAGKFQIKMCYKYYDEDDGITETFQWCDKRSVKCNQLVVFLLACSTEHNEFGQHHSTPCFLSLVI